MLCRSFSHCCLVPQGKVKHIMQRGHGCRPSMPHALNPSLLYPTLPYPTLNIPYPSPYGVTKAPAALVAIPR